MKGKSIKLTYFDLPKSVYVLVFARIISSMGNFVFPFMTLLLTSKIGLGERQVGFFLLMASALQIPGALLGGKLSDIMGRKKIMIAATTLSAICLLPCAVFIDSADTLIYIPWILILATFFNSVSGPANSAMVNDLTVPNNRQAAMSLLYMAMNVGTAIGSVVSGLLFNNHMKILFVGDALSKLISIILLVKFVKESKPSNEDLDNISDLRRADEKPEEGGLISALLKRPMLLIFSLLNMIYSFIYAQTHFSMPLQVNSIFGEELGAGYFGTLNMINCIEVILLTTIITIITRKIRSIYNVSIAGIFYAIGFGMLFFVNNLPLFILSTIIWTIGEIINSTNIGVYIANHTPISHRGRFNAMINIISSTGSSISPYLMGSVIESKGVTNVWPIIFILGLTASFLMFLLGSYEKRTEKDISLRLDK